MKTKKLGLWLASLVAFDLLWWLLPHLLMIVVIAASLGAAITYDAGSKLLGHGPERRSLKDKF